MKRIDVGVGVALAVLSVLGVSLFMRRRGEKDTDPIDGGVVKRHWDDMPKVIESTEIVEFHCTISLLAAADTEEMGHRVYKLDAVLKDEEVQVKYDWYERQGKSDKAEYRADADFMVRLQEIVAYHDFAQHNGYSHTVSGLPDMYGERIDIVYASGECIYVHDNQSGFLGREAQKKLIALFGAATKMETE